MHRRNFLYAALSTLASGTVFAQAWPGKPIKMIVPYPPGGANDITARIYGQHLAAALGQSIVIENRAGAGGEIGAEAAAKSAGDGYTLLFAAIGSLTIHAVAATNKPYDLKTDLLPVSMGAGVPLALAVRATLPVSNVKEFLEYARAQKQALSYGSAGSGSTQHMTGEYFKQAAGIDLVHVPYKGSGPAMTDLLGGQIDVVFETLPALSAHYTNPKIKILAVTSGARSSMLAELPTLRESGVADFDVTTYYGLLAPKGTPKPIVDQLSAAMQAVAKKPEFVAAMSKAGADAITTTPDRMDAMVKGEIEKWGRVQKTAQVKL
ncbi:Bug family tripartite tricarboxylate transporter substrate binding protein [Caenimonas soli]|uniref:Bug family tripartite tricarboxylate transporter substrate binding protein n=1 Tax=Caenimonas soli TaxID=2735555 RepID=UPI0015523412|nr:tripartite tricarboxylate transporter substrate binding protein [Caenimonas soli]NPC59104.1 tripartite tricarboxylate transporter substrate binding protein [Caenimonas soli]